MNVIRFSRPARIASVALSCFATLPVASREQEPPDSTTIWNWRASPEALALVGGMVFDGVGFTKKDVFVDNGVIVLQRPERARRLDVSDSYLTPAFGDAHVHRFAGDWDAGESREWFLRLGFAFVMNWNSPKSARDECASFINRPSGVDVLFANGGFTSKGGHPIKLHESIHLRHGGTPETFRDSVEGDRVFVVQSEQEIHDKLAVHRASKPDLLKLFLLYSDEFDKRKADERYYGSRGLRPDLAVKIAAMARARGLRVGAHVENRADYLVALEANANFILHTPGYNLPGEGNEPGRFLLRAEDAAELIRRGTIHVTTASLISSRNGLETVRANLHSLKSAGAKIVFGSDNYSSGPEREIRLLRALGVFSDVELLNMLCHDTPTAMFPGRKVGRLEPGFEANVLVFDGDPIQDRRQLLAGPRGVVKQGAVLRHP